MSDVGASYFDSGYGYVSGYIHRHDSGVGGVLMLTGDFALAAQNSLKKRIGDALSRLNLVHEMVQVDLFAVFRGAAPASWSSVVGRSLLEALKSIPTAHPVNVHIAYFTNKERTQWTFEMGEDGDDD